MHELDDAARFEPLARVSESRPAIFIAAEASTRKLSIHSHHRLVISLCRLQVLFLPNLLIINSRLTEALGNVYVMPIDNTAVPARHVIMDLLGEIEQPGFSGSVVNPIGGFDGVAEPYLRPISGAKI